MKNSNNDLVHSKSVCGDKTDINIKRVKKRELNEAFVTNINLADRLDTMEGNQQLILYHQMINFKQAYDDNQKIISFVEPKRKKRVQGKKKRDAIPIDILNIIINTPRREGQRKLNYHRFVCIAVVLFFSGMRITECASLTQINIEELIKNQTTEVKRTKNNDFFYYRCSKSGSGAIKSIKLHFDYIFKDYRELGCGITSNSLIRCINQELSYYSKTYSLNLSSHSFRIGRITNLLDNKVSLEETSYYIGHKNLQTTILYQRNDRLKQETFNKIDLMDKKSI